MESDSALVKIANAILLSAVKKHATEIRIRRDGPRSVVDFVIDGAVTEEMDPPLRIHSYIVRRLAIMARLPMHGKEQWTEGIIIFKLKDRTVGFAIHVRGHGDDVVATLRRLSDAELATHAT